MVEEEQHLCEQPVAAAQIDDATAAQQPPHPARDLPCFVQLFSGKASRMTHRACHAIEERVALESREVAIGQASL